MRWLILGLILIFGVVGIQTYRNVELTRYGYIIKKLEKSKEGLKENNANLERKISSSYSLGRLDSYARKKLSLTDPKKVRFLEKRVFPKEKMPSQVQRFPFISAIFKILKKVKSSTFNVLRSTLMMSNG